MYPQRQEKRKEGHIIQEISSESGKMKDRWTSGSCLAEQEKMNPKYLHRR